MKAPSAARVKQNPLFVQVFLGTAAGGTTGSSFPGLQKIPRLPFQQAADVNSSGSAEQWSKTEDAPPATCTGVNHM